MNSSSGDFLSPQPDTFVIPAHNSVADASYGDNVEPNLLHEEPSQRHRIESLAAGTDGKGYIFIIDRQYR